LCSRLLAAPPDTTSAEWDEPPDAGFYLDANWQPVLADAPWATHFVDWPDFGAIHPTELTMLVAQIAYELAEGKRVELACLGAHGRTGTLLAALIGHVERLTADEAFRAARERYCQHAVETMGQIELLYRTLGEEPPPPEQFSRNR
jgi:protein-tyrosine phosphatase